MILRIRKWGNNLALRIPAALAREAGLKENCRVHATLTVDGGITIRAMRWNRAAFARELEKTRETMPMTDSVTDELRRAARF